MCNEGHNWVIDSALREGEATELYIRCGDCGANAIITLLEEEINESEEQEEEFIKLLNSGRAGAF